MNRNNFLLHVGLALVLILIAAFAGQIRQWQKQRHAFHYPGRPVISRPDVGPERIAPGAEKRKDLSEAELLVRFKSGTSETRIQSIVSRLNDRVEDEIESVSGLEVIEAQGGKDVDTDIAQYRALPEVEYAEPIFEIELDKNGGGPKPVIPNDPRFGEQWALANDGQRGGKEGADISAMRAWATTRGSHQVVVAVLDSGVDYNHPDLKNNIWTRPENISEYKDRDLGDIDDLHGFSAVDDSGDPMDENGHGTHCAGIIGAEGGNGDGIAGVNWTVQIMPLKFMDASGSGTTKDAIEAINYVINRQKAGVNVRIISASWGSTQKSRALEDVIHKAYDAGILLVAASGNSSVDTDKNPHYPASYNVGNIISVAALNRNDELASFSNYGAKSVHIAAPGAEILSTWLDHDFKEASGTSMATPMVAGVAALVLSKDPHMSVDQLRQRLLESIDKLPALRGRILTGGRINAAKAVGAE